jgi:hypothetical protein
MPGHGIPEARRFKHLQGMTLHNKPKLLWNFVCWSGIRETTLGGVEHPREGPSDGVGQR